MNCEQADDVNCEQADEVNCEQADDDVRHMINIPLFTKLQGETTNNVLCNATRHKL